MNSSMLGTGRNWTRRSIEEIGYDIFNRLYKPGGDGLDIATARPLYFCYDYQDSSDDPRDNQHMVNSSFTAQEFNRDTTGKELFGVYVHTGNFTVASYIPLYGENLIIPEDEGVYEEIPVCYGSTILGDPEHQPLGSNNGDVFGEYQGAFTLEDFTTTSGNIAHYAPGLFSLKDSNDTQLFMMFRVPYTDEHGQRQFEDKWFEVYYAYSEETDLLYNHQDPDFGFKYELRSPYRDPRTQEWLNYTWNIEMTIAFTNIHNWDAIDSALKHATQHLASRYNYPALGTAQNLILLQTGKFKDLIKVKYTPEKILFP